MNRITPRRDPAVASARSSVHGQRRSRPSPANRTNTCQHGGNGDGRANLQRVDAEAGSRTLLEPRSPAAQARFCLYPRRPCTYRQRMIQTVRGPVEAADLGTTLMHEHVFTLDPEAVQNRVTDWEEDKEVANAVERLDELAD